MKLVIAISKVSDGDMLSINDRHKFLASHGINTDDATYVKLRYEGNDYCRYHEVDESHMGKGMRADDIISADALITKAIGHALFLPLADCIGAVCYDPIKKIMMLSHLGRHNLEQNGGKKSIEFMSSGYNCDPAQILVRLSPAAGRDNYPLFAFDNKSLKEVAIDQFISAGVKNENIKDNPIDTTTNLDYFSHSEFLKGNRDLDGRFAIVAMMRK